MLGCFNDAGPRFYVVPRFIANKVYYIVGGGRPMIQKLCVFLSVKYKFSPLAFGKINYGLDLNPFGLDFKVPAAGNEIAGCPGTREFNCSASSNRRMLNCRSSSVISRRNSFNAEVTLAS